MTRTKKFFLNSISTAIYQVVVMIVGFITPKILLSTYGSEINGLVSSISQFITYFSLVEAGIAGAAVYSLYKPLAEDDHKAISVVVSSAKKFYLKAGYIFTGLVIVLAILYPIFVKVDQMSFLTMALLVFVLGAKGFFEFFTLAKYRVLLTADQKTYIISNASTIYIIIQMILIAVLAKFNCNIVLVYTLAIIALLSRTLILMFYTKKHYSYIDYKAPVNEKTLDKRWDALFLQIVQTVQTGAPVVLATIFTNLKSVSIYTVYNMVLGGINGVLSIFINGLYASFGDIIARKEEDKLKKVYREYEFIYYIIVAFIYSVAMILIMPFIQLYTRGITDANYMQPIIGFLFVLNGILYSLKNPQGMLVMSAGLYKETRIQCVIQSAFIILGGIILAPKFGIVGILIANCLSNIYRTIEMGFFIPKNVTKLKPAQSFKRMLLVITIILLGVLPFCFINLNINSYLDWIITAIFLCIYIAIIIAILTVIFEREQLKSVVSRVRNIFAGKLKFIEKKKKPIIFILVILTLSLGIILGGYLFKFDIIQIKNQDNENIYTYLIEEEVENVQFEITSKKNNTDLKLTIENKNLFTGNYENGFIDSSKNQLELSDSGNDIYRTTEWITIPEGTNYLTLSGNGFNRANWQFLSKTGELSTYSENKDFRSIDGIWGNKSSSTVQIQEGTAKVRVYYAKLTDTSTQELGEEIQIEIGAINTSYEKNSVEEIPLPQLNKGDKITYNGKKWKYNEIILDIPSININQKSLIKILGKNYELNVDCTEKEKEYKKDGIYGVKWNEESSSPICIRTDDAEDLNTNYYIENKLATPYKNDFDYIFPWSEMKLCNVYYSKDGNREIIYQDDERFSLNGTMGNVMVEIPKHYIKSEKNGEWNYLWITGEKQDGFILDPSFITAEGEIDYIYVAAYQTALLNDKLVSQEKTYPLINLSFFEIEEKMEEEYSELDLLAVNTLQRLFVIEMAVLDSQSIFLGNTNLVYFDHSFSGNTAAQTTEKETNRIIVADSLENRKFKKGDSITLSNSVSEWRNFLNEEDIYQRTITKMEENNNQLLITFSRTTNRCDSRHNNYYSYSKDKWTD